ncbi:MAG: HdeD family acid-resistance protein [Bilifractor sp.]|jgi:uncharacterized membrane protein HdeD (DUF308 family)|nr:DUF308 domain-containing protein [Lachnospiraceae bacterium]
MHFFNRDEWHGYLQRNKMRMTILAVIEIVIGVLFLVWPSDTEAVILRIFGAGLAAGGIFFLVGGSAAVLPMERYMSGVLGGINILFGILLLINPIGFIVFAMVIVGLILMVYGIMGIVSAFDIRSMGSGAWTGVLAAGIIALILGILAMAHPVNMIGIIVGIALLYVGVTMLIAVHRLSDFGKSARDFMDDHNDDVIDTTGVERDADDDR